eukprot:scaffold293254_cov31-Tisochrysis_lutea.AAC.1
MGWPQATTGQGERDRRLCQGERESGGECGEWANSQQGNPLLALAQSGSWQAIRHMPGAWVAPLPWQGR